MVLWQNIKKDTVMIFLAPLVGGLCSLVSGAAATATTAAAATVATVGTMSAGTIGTIAAGSIAAGALMSSGAKRRAAEAEARSIRAEAQVRELQSQVASLQACCGEDDADSEDLVRLAELQEEIEAISSRVKRHA